MPVLGKTKKEVLSEFRCTEILDAARQVFALKGFSDATVDEIADAAGVAKGTVYLYFPSKRDIFVAALREGLVEVHARTRQEMQAAQTAAAKIRAFIGTRLASADEHRDFFRIYYSELSKLLVRPAQILPELRDLYEQQAKLLEDAIEHGIEIGEIRPINAYEAAHVIYEMTRGMIAQRVLGWSQGTVAETEEFLFNLIWRGIACNGNTHS